jgi:hypothetical protein
MLQTTKKNEADKHTHTRNNKINEGKPHRKNTNGNVKSVTTWGERWGEKGKKLRS